MLEFENALRREFEEDLNEDGLSILSRLVRTDIPEDGCPTKSDMRLSAITAAAFQVFEICCEAYTWTILIPLTPYPALSSTVLGLGVIMKAAEGTQRGFSEKKMAQ